jgi:hypothetical protein
VKGEFDNRKSSILSKSLAKKLKAPGGYVGIETDTAKNHLYIEITNYNIFES